MTLTPHEETAALESVRYLVLALINRCVAAHPHLLRHKEDLEQEAMIDAVLAIRTWDPARESKLSSWVALRVEFKLRRNWKTYSESKGIHVPIGLWAGELTPEVKAALAPPAPMSATDAMPARADAGEGGDEARRLEAADTLRVRLAVLPAKWRKIVRDRLGLFGRPRRTLQEIADDHGLSRERIRQIEQAAMTRLGVPSAHDIAGAA